MGLTGDGAYAVYFGSDDGKMYALNSYCGGVLWSHQTGGTVRSSPALVEDQAEPENSFIYFGSDDANVYSLNATNGSVPCRVTEDVPSRACTLLAWVAPPCLRA